MSRRLCVSIPGIVFSLCYLACGSGSAQVIVTQYSTFSGNGPALTEGIIDPLEVTSGVYASQASIASGYVDSRSTPAVSSNIFGGPDPYFGAGSFGELSYRFEVKGRPNSQVPVDFIGKTNLYSHFGEAEVDTIFVTTAVSNFSIYSDIGSFGNSVGMQTKISNFSIANGLLGYIDSGAVASKIEASTHGSRGSFIELSTAGGNIRGEGGSQPPLPSNTISLSSGVVNGLERLDGLFGGTILIVTNSQGVGSGSVHLSAFAGSGSLNGDSKGFSIASSFIDPYLYINPTYLSSNSSASLRVLDGVGNGPISPVPESSALVYMCLGCVLLWLQSKFPMDRGLRQRLNGARTLSPKVS